jgi:predicted nucleic acid-binding protein
MARQRRRNPGVGGTLLLDADGVTKAASNDLRVQAFLTSARRRDARVVVSAITLAEVLRGGKGDAAVHRVLSRVSHTPVSTALARAAGGLLGSTGVTDATLDAVLAATALAEPLPVILLTSDPADLSRLTAGHPSISVQKI